MSFSEYQLDTITTTTDTFFNDNNNYKTHQFQDKIATFEDQIINSTEPLEIKNGAETILFNNNQTGIWLNKEECDAWQGHLPLSEYKLNEDKDPIIIRKKLLNYPIDYRQQNVQIIYLKPPTPPPHGDLIIKQEDDIILDEYVPPQIVRIQNNSTSENNNNNNNNNNNREETPPPIIIREQPPDLPKSLPTQTITIPGKIITDQSTTRQIIIEHMPSPPPSSPAKPQQIIIEKWLPYEKQKRKVIFEKASSDSNRITKPTNLNVKTKFLNIDIEIPSSMRNNGLEIEIEYKLNKSLMSNNNNNNNNNNHCCQNNHHHCCTTSKKTVIHSLPNKQQTIIPRYYSFSAIHDHLKKTLW